MEAEQTISLQPLDDPHPLFSADDEVAPDELRCLILDPLCHKEASATLFQHRGRELPVPLFAAGPLSGNLAASPWVASLVDARAGLFSWIEHQSPPGWGMFCCSTFDWPSVISHLRTLVLARGSAEDNGRELVFRFWDNRILCRIARGLPQACSRLMGPLTSLVTQDETGAWFKIVNCRPACLPPRTPFPWYVFDDAHAALFADRAEEVTAYNVSERIYAALETEDIPLPSGETLPQFALRQIARTRPLCLTSEEELTSYVLCALYTGEEQAFRTASAASDRQDILRDLWRGDTRPADQREEI